MDVIRLDRFTTTFVWLILLTVACVSSTRLDPTPTLQVTVTTPAESLPSTLVIPETPEATITDTPLPSETPTPAMVVSEKGRTRIAFSPPWGTTTGQHRLPNPTSITSHFQATSVIMISPGGRCIFLR